MYVRCAVTKATTYHNRTRKDPVLAYIYNNLLLQEGYSTTMSITGSLSTHALFSIKLIVDMYLHELFIFPILRITNANTAQYLYFCFRFALTCLIASEISLEFIYLLDWVFMAFGHGIARKRHFDLPYHLYRPPLARSR
jgi:hypothetical protein